MNKPPQRPHLREISSTPCPRCGGAFEKGALECGSCGLIFAKMKKPGDMPGISTPTSLESAWQGVLAKFDQESEHNSFIEKCITTNNALFASQKYRQLLEANPSDPIAAKMRDRIITRVTSIYLARMPGQEVEGTSFRTKVMYFLFGLGVMMVLIGAALPKGVGTIILYSGFVALLIAGALFGIGKLT